MEKWTNSKVLYLKQLIHPLKLSFKLKANFVEIANTYIYEKKLIKFHKNKWDGKVGAEISMFVEHFFVLSKECNSNTNICSYDKIMENSSGGSRKFYK